MWSTICFGASLNTSSLIYGPILPGLCAAGTCVLVTQHAYCLCKGWCATERNLATATRVQEAVLKMTTARAVALVNQHGGWGCGWEEQGGDGMRQREMKMTTNQGWERGCMGRRTFFYLKEVFTAWHSHTGCSMCHIAVPASGTRVVR